MAQIKCENPFCRAVLNERQNVNFDYRVHCPIRQNDISELYWTGKNNRASVMRLVVTTIYHAKPIDGSSIHDLGLIVSPINICLVGTTWIWTE